jgi:hypothetical protein
MQKLRSILSILSLIIIFSSCKKDDPPLPDNLINFEATEQGIASENTDAEIKLSLSRVTDVAIPLTIELQPSGLTYGTEFTTAPAATANILTATIAAGSSSTSFKVTKAAGIFLQGNEFIRAIIKTASSPVLRGTTDTLVIKFSSIVSTGSQLTLEGKTSVSAYANSVFADLSNNKQTPVDRKSWNLGFYNGADFKVIINQAFQATAKALSKTDITTVGFADTAGVQLNHNIEDPATVSLVDYWDGDMSKTAFAGVSATDADNKVYLVSFETSKNQDQYFKVKVTRNSNGYKVQYARVGETTIKTVDVPKTADYNFSFVSLETNNVVSVEPKKANWDIEWSYGTYNSGLGSPYWFQDLILLNHVGGVQAAEVLETAVTYDAFVESNIAAVSFSTKRDAIGSKWRQGAGPSGAGSIKRDRFYVIKDSQSNVYKLKFISWGGGGDAGERGRPVIEYKLVKKGA